MRTLIRETLQIDRGVNLEELPVKDKLYAGALSWVQNFSLYRKYRAEKESTLLKEKAEKDAVVRQQLLSEIAQHLNNSEENKVIYVAVDASLKQSLFRVLGLDSNGNPMEGANVSALFNEYNLSLVAENHDMRIAFDNMPYVVQCYKKHLNGGEL